MMDNKELSPKERKAWDQWLRTLHRLEETTKPSAKGESAAAKKKRIKMLLNPKNFEKFIHYYFATEDFKPAPLAWFHHEAIKNLFVRKKRKHLWEWHRESAKSVFAEIFVVIHKLVSGELDGLILGGKTQAKAQNLLKDIEKQLRANKRLSADFGEFGIGGSWAQGYFYTNKGIGFWAFGLGQDPAGSREGFKRPNFGIIDDVDSYSKAEKNQQAIKDQLKWIKGEFMGCLATKNNTFIYTNNRIHPKGITAHMAGDVEEDDEKDESFAHIKVYLTEDPITHEAIYPEGKTEEAMVASLKKQGAVPAWKEFYTLEDCAAKMKDMGPSDGFRQLYHKHEIDGDVFTDEMMPWVEPLPLSSYDALCSYCDPAFGESGKGSHKAIVFLGKIGNHYDVLWVWLRQSGNWMVAHRELATGLHNLECVPGAKHDGKKVRDKAKHHCEGNNLQKTELKKTWKIVNMDYDTAWLPKFDDNHKGDKIGRVENMETIFIGEYVRFNSWMKKSKDMKTLREQFKSFPNGAIDGPDALHGAKTKIDKMGKKSGGSGMKAGKYKKKDRR